MEFSLNLAVKQFISLFTDNSTSNSRSINSEFSKKLVDLRYLLCKAKVPEIDPIHSTMVINILINKISYTSEFSIIYNSLLCLIEMNINPSIFSSDVFVKKYLQTLYSVLDQNKEIMNLSLKLIEQIVREEKYEKFLFSGFIIVKLRSISYSTNLFETLQLISSILQHSSHYLLNTQEYKYVDLILEITKNLLKLNKQAINKNILCIYANFSKIITEPSKMNEIMTNSYKLLTTNAFTTISMKILFRLALNGYDYTELLKDPEFLNTILSQCYHHDTEHRIKLLKLLDIFIDISPDFSKNLIQIDFQQYLIQDIQSNNSKLLFLGLKIMKSLIVDLDTLRIERLLNNLFIKMLLQVAKKNDETTNSIIFDIMNTIQDKSIPITHENISTFNILKDLMNIQDANLKIP